MTVADDWVSASLAAKRFATSTLAEANEWLFLAVVVRAVRLLRQSLADIQHHGRPRIAGPIGLLPTGQAEAQVVPRDP